MPPKDPPKRGWPPPVTEVNAARGPHTPIPDARTAPPPAMPMGPPKHLAAPRTRLDSHRDDPTLVGLAPPAERRPEPVNPPPPESMRPTIADRASEPPAGQVVLGKGKWSLSMPSVVALALIASVGGFATAWLNKPNAGDPAEIAKAIRDEAAKAKEERAVVDAAILKRLDGAETKLDRLQDSQDRLRERFNERFAKP